MKDVSGPVAALGRDWSELHGRTCASLPLTPRSPLASVSLICGPKPSIEHPSLLICSLQLQRSREHSLTWRNLAVQERNRSGEDNPGGVTLPEQLKKRQRPHERPRCCGVRKPYRSGFPGCACSSEQWPASGLGAQLVSDLQVLDELVSGCTFGRKWPEQRMISG